MENLLHIKDFSLLISEGDGFRTILDSLNLSVGRGQIVGLRGASGSGKSLTISSILQLVQYQNSGFRQSGEILFDGQSLINHPDINRIRNQHIGIVFQQSSQVFNPSQRIGQQLKEKLVLFSKVESPHSIILNSLETVRLNEPQKIYNAYPHELSGGQIQRCLVAMAIINKPSLIIADEPFSSLDSVVKDELIHLFRDISKSLGSSVLLVSHNHAVLDRLCDRIYSIDNGQIVENSSPSFQPLTVLTKEPSMTPLVEIKDISMDYKSGFFRSNKVAVLREINITIHEAEIVGLYGNSGAGKSTLARLLTRLEQPSSGQILYRGRDVNNLSKVALQEYKSKCQIIFQDSYSSMSPHRTVKQHLSDVFYVLNKPFDNDEVSRYFSMLSLDNELLTRFRHQLSGGQRQRIMIIRALLLGAEFLICDEILASLDAQVGHLLLDELIQLNQSHGLTILFISHDLDALDKFCNRLIDLDQVNRI